LLLFGKGMHYRMQVAVREWMTTLNILFFTKNRLSVTFFRKKTREEQYIIYSFSPKKINRLG